MCKCKTRLRALSQGVIPEAALVQDMAVFSCCFKALKKKKNNNKKCLELCHIDISVSLKHLELLSISSSESCE